MHKDTSAQPRLLLQNIFNYGHFLVYASVFTRWGLSRGFEVHMLGRGLQGTTYERRFAGHPGVVLHDASPGERLDPLKADWAKPDLLRASLDAVLAAQRELRPRTTVLLSTDDYLFEGVGVTEEGFRFETPTCGLTTFGHREHYTAYADGHARRLARMIERRSPFSTMFTLDEYHASDTGADPAYLAFLPDIYCEDAPDAPATGEDSRSERELSRFLDAGQGPVVPVIGKFDRRKNNLWVLEMAASIPDASCVVLGERVPGPDDARIDDLLRELRAQGRLFELWGFVPEILFHMVLGHERTAFLALPYSCHYGSSGIQLIGLAHGKPTLAPSGGLMARRIADHGLGRVFTAGNRTDFEKGFRDLLELGAAPFRARTLRFMEHFSEPARHGQIDRALGLSGNVLAQVPLLEGTCPDEGLHHALALYWNGRREEALALMEQVLLRAPDDPVTIFRMATMLFGMDRIQEAAQGMRRCLQLGGGEECDFFVRRYVQDARELLDAGDRAGAVERVRRALQLVREDGQDGSPVLSASTWREIGSILARSGEHAQAVESFRQALLLAPDLHDVRLNISDALRYAGRFAESLRELDALEAAAPGWFGLDHKRGQVFFEMGEAKHALGYFLREPQDSPHRHAAMVYINRIRAEC